LGLSDEQIIRNHKEFGHVCWDQHDLIEGLPTGAVRVSIPYCCTFEDIEVSFFYSFLFFGVILMFTIPQFRFRNLLNSLRRILLRNPLHLKQYHVLLQVEKFFQSFKIHPWMYF
jgi:hypothetical protein